MFLKTRSPLNPLSTSPAKSRQSNSTSSHLYPSNIIPLHIQLDDLKDELDSLLAYVELDVELAQLQQELLLLMKEYEFSQQTQELNRQVAALLAALLLYGSGGLNLNNSTPTSKVDWHTGQHLNKTEQVTTNSGRKLNKRGNVSSILSAPSLNKTIQSKEELHELFATPTSVGNKAICAAEGNCDLDGQHTANWYGHPDPGDRKLNMGFCSIAPGRNDGFNGGTPEEADVACVSYITRKVESVFRDYQRAGVKPTLENLVSSLDLFNQAAPVHSSLLPQELASVERSNPSASSVQKIATARAKTFWINGKFKAGGLWRACQNRTNWSGSKWDCVYSDQLRRVEAIHSLLNKVVESTNSLNKNLTQTLNKNLAKLVEPARANEVNVSNVSNHSNQLNKTKAQQVVEKALSWTFNPDGTRKYVHFKEGQTARCADFVRHVIKSVGLSVPVSNNPIDKEQQWNGPYGLRAQSFFGTDVGEIIYNVEGLEPGDLVAFANTYGNWAEGSITHVGIYIGKDKEGRHMMVDRSTSSKPVFYRPLSSFKKFRAGVRPYAYKQ